MPALLERLPPVAAVVMEPVFVTSVSPRPRLSTTMPNSVEWIVAAVVTL